MLCDTCGKKTALVHITGMSRVDDGPEIHTEQHFCEDCADEYYASQPHMTACRRLIQLSDRFRSKLYDRLEAEHPDVFDCEDTEEALHRSSETMFRFLNESLQKEGIEVSGTALDMLHSDFIGTAEVYDRRRRRRGE